jgi:HD-GYP domain-containing protein (c-di-GMP phosphodiesterase class II)
MLDSYESPAAEALLRAGEQRRAHPIEHRREFATQVAAASSFLLAGGLLAALAPWHRTLSATTLLLVVAVYVAIERVRFPVAGGWTYPTMLAFVPMLFVLPTPVVPVVAVLAIVLGALPGYVRRDTPLSRIPSDIADAWYTFVPALVIVVGGAEHFSWSHWPVYVGALCGQLVFDMAAWITRSWFAEGVLPQIQLPLLMWTYLVDATLAPLGLVIAAAATNRPALVLISLSPMAMLTLFARERQQRLDRTLALSTAYRGTALVLGDVIEADDEYTGSHSRDVVDLSLAVADALGIDSQKRQNIEFAALLHDVGKIRVPKDVLNKTGELDEDETAILRRHTIDGETMLKQVGGTLSGVGRIVRATHERYDGFGYPDGLAGEEIPIEARIICACDAFSAMTTNRPYRDALPVARAVAELKHCARTQFDPAVVAALVETIMLERSTRSAPEESSAEQHGSRQPSESHQYSMVMPESAPRKRPAPEPAGPRPRTWPALPAR